MMHVDVTSFFQNRYFKASEFKAPSSYWDRDGFCGHEVVGVVTESKSDKFKPGDEVMAS